MWLISWLNSPKTATSQDWPHLSSLQTITNVVNNVAKTTNAFSLHFLLETLRLLVILAQAPGYSPSITLFILISLEYQIKTWGGWTAGMQCNKRWVFQTTVLRKKTCWKRKEGRISRFVFFLTWLFHTPFSKMSFVHTNHLSLFLKPTQRDIVLLWLNPSQ